MKRILFITGTRADYGKIKSLIRIVDNDQSYKTFVFVSGMHLLEQLGSTYMEVLKDNYKNVYVDFSQTNSGVMSYDLGNVICNLTNYVRQIKPDLIVVHGDRIDTMAGAIVGALNNILVAHIEGGELSGTIDESIRHSITKLAHIHLVCNREAKNRLIQLGEEEKRIYIMGSPDIDIMLSNNLPSISETKERYEIPYDKYGILMYHPVTTEIDKLEKNIENVIKAVELSKKNMVVIYPNNDLGAEIIISRLRKLKGNSKFRVFPSIRFEYFLALLKNADFMIGNSSAGVRETGVYGVPGIDIGTRQFGRYSMNNTNIQHVYENVSDIITAINKIDNYRKKCYQFGAGNSTDKFYTLLKNNCFWNIPIQKRFIDLKK